MNQEAPVVPLHRSGRVWRVFGGVAFYLLFVPLARFWALWRVGSRHHLFLNGDVYHEYWPDLHLYVEALRHGDWPLYNPFVNLGFPIVSDPQVGVYYPFSWMYLVAGAFLDRVSAYYVFEWVTLVPVGLLGLGMHLYLRQLGLSHRAALLGSLAAMSNGFINYSFHMKFIQSFAWIPWLMVTLEWLLVRATLRRAVAVGLVVGLSVLAGGPPGVFYLVFWTTAYFGFRVIQESRRQGWRVIVPPLLRWLPLSVLVAGCVGAVVVFPFLDVAGMTRRVGVGYDFVADTSIRVSYLLSHVLPGYELMIYEGVLTLVLAVAALSLARRYRGLVIFCVVMFGLGILLSLGQYAFPLELVYLGFPGAGAFRSSMRYRCLCGLALPILVAVGFDTLCLWSTQRRRARFFAWARWSGLALVSFLVSVAWSERLFSAAPQSWRMLLHLGVVLLVGIYCLDALAQEGRSRLLFLVFGGLFVYDLYAKPPQYEALPYFRLLGWRSPALRQGPRGFRAPYRTMNDIEDGPRNAANLYLVRDAMGYPHPLLPKRYFKLMEEVRRDPDVLRFFNVRRYLACLPGNDHYHWCLSRRKRFSGRWRRGARKNFVQIYELRDPIPRVLWVPRIVVVDKKSDVLPAMRRLDPWKEAVVVAGDVPDLRGVRWSRWPSRMRLRGQRRRRAFRGLAGSLRKAGFNTLEATIKAHHEGFVVINEAHYPAWRATVDGKAVSIVRMNFMLMGVRVPAGSHRLRLTYRPRSFLVGASLSGFVFVLALLFLLFDRRVPLRAPAPNPACF